jgi:hypothetical protein
MTRFLLAVTAAIGALAFTTPAGACDVYHCPGTSVVCQHVYCGPICYQTEYQYECIGTVAR